MTLLLWLDSYYVTQCSHAGCCGGQVLYNKSSQICCENYGLYSVAATKNKKCCLDKIYDVRGHFCEKGHILSFQEDLCGMKKYNIYEKKCCDRKLHDMPQFLPDCCGSHLFDVNKSKCCKKGKTIIPINLECCGEGK